jgi:hypothetical protein
MLYTVVGQIVRTSDNGWRSSVCIPTFLLDSGIQGITDVEHAAGVALSMLRDIAGDDAAIHFGICDTDGHYATEKHGQRKLGVTR